LIELQSILILPPIEYSIASDPVDYFKAYQLRFQVFTEEQGDTRYANFDNQTYTDIYDQGDQAILLVAKDGKRVIATQRLIHRKYGPYLGDHLLQYEILANLFSLPKNEILEKLFIRTRSVVDANYRGQGVFSNLVRSGEQIARSQGGICIIGVVDQKKTEVRQINRSLGYKPYGICDSFSGLEGELIYRDIQL